MQVFIFWFWKYRPNRRKLVELYFNEHILQKEKESLIRQRENQDKWKLR